MLIRSSSFISDNVALLTLGHTCCYLVCLQKHNILIDPGLSIHFPFTVKRLRTVAGLSITDLTDVLLTNLNPDRIAAAALLRKHNPQIKIRGGYGMSTRFSDLNTVRSLYEQDQWLLQLFGHSDGTASIESAEFTDLLQFEQLVKDGEIVIADPQGELRAIAFPGHTPESWCYLVQPDGVLIADQGIGYYRGRELAAPGADHDLEKSLSSLQKLQKIAINSLALPCFGVLTGDLAKEYLPQLTTNTADLLEQTRIAFEASFPSEHIFETIRNSFYITNSTDPLVCHKINGSLSAVWQQLQNLSRTTSST